jgi:hypothetical protein
MLRLTFNRNFRLNLWLVHCTPPLLSYAMNLPLQQVIVPTWTRERRDSVSAGRSLVATLPFSQGPMPVAHRLVSKWFFVDFTTVETYDSRRAAREEDFPWPPSDALQIRSSAEFSATTE